MRRALTGLPAACLLLLVLALASLFVGVGSVSLGALLAQGLDGPAGDLLLISRLPRTLALLLVGASMAIAGMIMQMLARNRFVEPSTMGAVESAQLGILVVMLTAPGLPVFGRMLVAAAFALAGTALFMRILRAVPLRSIVMVPLIGIMLGGVIGAVTTFLAYRYDLLQSIGAWTLGDFSMILRGRYELLWIAAAMTLLAYVAADRFTVAGLGEDFASNLGLNHRRVMLLGLLIVSVVTAGVFVTAGVIPFLGLIVPNVVSLLMGDNLRRSLPWIALLGAALVLACDIAGRLVIHPYEVPVGVVLGILGSGFFLYLLLRRGARVA